MVRKHVSYELRIWSYEFTVLLTGVAGYKFMYLINYFSH